MNVAAVWSQTGLASLPDTRMTLQQQQQRPRPQNVSIGCEKLQNAYQGQQMSAEPRLVDFSILGELCATEQSKINCLEESRRRAFNFTSNTLEKH